MVFRIAKILIAVVLVALVAAQIGTQFFPSTVTRPGPLEEIIPMDLAGGWIGEEIPLAHTEEMRAVTEQILQFDEVISRRYTKGDLNLSLYIAYWEPGKVPIRKVGVHTPDTCWVQNGWTREERRHALIQEAGGRVLQPCEYGLFSIRNHYEHVVFWHLVGGEVHSYDQHGMHNIWSPITDLFSKGLNQRRDQYFIRISSDTYLFDIWDDPGFQELLSAVGKLGAFADRPEDSAAAPDLATVMD